jgi:hypothetical protein
MSKKIERHILFYRIDAGQDAVGRPSTFDVLPILSHLSGLSKQRRFLDEGEGNGSLCIVDHLQPLPSLRLYSIRRADLPLFEEDGDLSPLPISQKAGIAESIHVIFFEDGIVGAEFNFYGPRIGRLSRYLQRQCEFCPSFTFVPLLRLDAAEALRRMRSISMLKLRIIPSYISAIESADDSLANSFRAAFQVGESEEVELVLRPRPHSRTSLSERMLFTVRQLAERDDIKDGSKEFVVRGYDEDLGKSDTVDILKEQLQTTKKVVCVDDRTRALDATSAYTAIEEAFNDLRVSLLKAAGGIIYAASP